MIKIAAMALLATCAGYGIYAFGQGRLDARPTVVALSSSSSNGMSFAWLYDPTERTVYVCRVGGTSESLDCKAKATLP